MRLEEEFHGVVRLQVALGKMDGYRFDKRCLRYNDMVHTALNYGRCRKEFSEGAAWAGLDEVIEAASPDFPEMYSPDGVMSLCPDWMAKHCRGQE